MKKIFSFVFAAMMLLVSSSAMAQSETLKGDVNADGVVDVADIAAIIKIMQEAGGAVEETKYYWYVGQENPASMTSISPIVDDNTSPGWRYLGTDLTKYNSSNPIFEGALKYSITFTGRATAYLALPSSTIKLYDDTGYDGVLSDAWTKTGEREINGVKYYIYTSNTILKAWGADVY